jgi:nitrogen fixation/metabolism regulation signal transduction histidine kinase
VTSHLALMLVFSLLVSVVLATLMRDEPRAQLRLAARMVAGFMLAAIVGGWLIYGLPF